jgi:photosystem II stability/assembly factor-like uncharacterized protein
LPKLLSYKIAAIAAIACLFAVARFARADDARWASNGPPAGIDTIAVAPSDPQVIYAGSTGADGGKGIFKSSDGGRNWIAINYGITNKRINAIAVNPHNSKIVYAGYEGEGFYKTTDGGEHWATINSTPLHHGTSIAIDRFDSSIVYLGTDSGLFKSFDGGRTVARLKNGQSQIGTVVNIVIDPRDNHTLYVSKFHDTEENSGIWNSKDAGATWTAVNTGLSGGPLRQMGKDRQIDSARLTFALAIDPRDSKTLYTGTLGAGVFKTTDGGEHWTRATDGINTGMPFGNNVYSLAINPLDSRRIYAGTAGGGIYKTIDAGKRWIADSDGLPPQNEHGKMTGIVWALIATHNHNAIYAGIYGNPDSNADGVYQTTMR